ncbi:23S rRNA (cytidine(2498)-2'-O)-methyltransferase RlmM [Saccharobesus litoralis]|uniref:Ribosomal RNA large subunit methyltransferase M n=1 Tax=Saccharobesus litoralis TaxID=2172099 RepID=A0A2S0VUB7_9ALTE|nr:23S rRNA (cytidine(2498)-2'-O)-methyltransferase RlmM [Saccharobesus litoralis]AWB67811.1 23S rRNA (cytidine(2498)-2'-O)-methyltransferase RlmM [Saccharobesus litoralis]
MANYILYCRAGFEKDLAGEIQAVAAEKQIFGYCKLNANQGFVEFNATEHEPGLLFKQIKLDSLIFCRQWFRVLEVLNDLAEGDRITPIVEALQGETFSDLTIDYPDTNEGKEVTKFAKKFHLPLSKALEKKRILQRNAKRTLHLFIQSSDTITLGVSVKSNASPHHLGIHRLRFPKDAPSRSTLKLEEAFLHFVPADERETRLMPGMNAVDLGACPGGWTYQLVKLGMFVAAIDNGTMNEDLMETGQVKHFMEDGFVYRPKKQNVYWLVCDMVEKPTKVARLMANWLARGDCQEAIFNLKLPMKQRYQSVQDSFAVIRDILADYDIRYTLQGKHLYHDREEITVHLRTIARY